MRAAGGGAVDRLRLPVADSRQAPRLVLRAVGSLPLREPILEVVGRIDRVEAITVDRGVHTREYFAELVLIGIQVYARLATKPSVGVPPGLVELIEVTRLSLR